MKPHLFQQLLVTSVLFPSAVGAAVLLLPGQGLAAPTLQRHPLRSTAATGRSAAALGPANWNQFSPPDSGFTVMMPGLAREISVRNPMHVPMHVFAFSPPGVAYGVQYFDIPATRLRATTPRMLLEMMVGGPVRAKNTTLLSEREIALDGYPGREVILSKPDSLGDQRQAIRVFLVKGRCFMVIATRYPTKIDPFKNRIEVFINSFRLLPDDVPATGSE